MKKARIAYEDFTKACGSECSYRFKCLSFVIIKTKTLQMRFQSAIAAVMLSAASVDAIKLDAGLGAEVDIESWWCQWKET